MKMSVSALAHYRVSLNCDRDSRRILVRAGIGTANEMVVDGDVEAAILDRLVRISPTGMRLAAAHAAHHSMRSRDRSRREAQRRGVSNRRAHRWAHFCLAGPLAGKSGSDFTAPASNRDRPDQQQSLAGCRHGVDETPSRIERLGIQFAAFSCTIRSALRHRLSQPGSYRFLCGITKSFFR